MDRRDILGLCGVLSILTTAVLWVDPYNALEKSGLFVTKYTLIIIGFVLGVYLLVFKKEAET